MLTQKISRTPELSEVSKFSKFSKFKTLGIGAAVVIAGSAVGGYLYLRGVFSDVSPLASAKLVPDEALAAGVVSTDGKVWSKLQQFGTEEAHQVVSKSVANLHKQLFAENTKIDYAKDIQPWLGSVVFALLPSNNPQEVTATTATTEEANYLVVIGIKDKISAISFATKLKKSSGGEKRESNYKGVKIWESTNKNQNTYIALLNEHLVISPQKKSIEAAIDTFQGEASFADILSAKLMLNKSIDLTNKIAEIHIPESQKVFTEVLDQHASISQLTPASIQQLKNMKSVVVGVGIDNLGIRIKAIGEVQKEPIKQVFQPTPGKMVSKFPLNTVALVSGYGISQGWREALAQAKKNPQFNQQVNGIRSYLKENVNLDLDKDILPWMDREFAVGAFPATEGVLAPMGFSAALVVKTSDRKAAETALSKLDKLAKTNSINIDRRHIEGKAVTEWSTNDQGVLLGHGWLDKESMFVAVGRPVVEAMASSSKTLEKNQAFQTVTNSLPKSNTGHFYVDMDTVMSVFNSNFLLNLQLPLDSDTCAILNSIRGIGVTANKVNPSTKQMEVIFALKSKESQSLASGQ